MGHLGPDGRPYQEEEQERLKRALFALNQEIGILPVSTLDLPTLREWHVRLCAEVERMQPGILRTTDITFGSWYGTVPARIEKEIQTLLGAVREQTDAIDQALQDPDEQLPAVVELGCMLHVELIRIHPFADGNGRIARVAQSWAHRRFGLNLVSFPERTAYLAALNRALYTKQLEPLKTLTLLNSMQ